MLLIKIVPQLIGIYLLLYYFINIFVILKYNRVIIAQPNITIRPFTYGNQRTHEKCYSSNDWYEHEHII